LGSLKVLLDKIVSGWPTTRKAKLLNLALSHIAEVSYFRLAKQGFCPSGIVDIGAYQGEWTRTIARIFPQAPILMIEAQSEKKPFLDAVAADLPLAESELCLLGDRDGSEAVFNVMETGSSIYNERSNIPRTQRRMTMRTLDGVLRAHPRLRAPLLVKLDVQGAELDVLRGGASVLQAAEFVQLEVALMSYNEGAPTANAVFNFMAEHDFLIFDICGFVRPNPSYLSQIDVLFVRKDSKLRADYFAF
jgi:FkbM family methyltransferase